MKLNRSLAMLAAAVLCAPPLSAQNMKLTGVNGQWATYTVGSGTESVYIGAYYAKMLAEPGQPTVDVFCEDFSHSISLNQEWTARFTNLGTGNLLDTRWGALGANQQQYMEAAWLVLQFNAQPTTEWAGIHSAIWNIFTPGTPAPSTDAAMWLGRAQTFWNDGSVVAGEWTVVTDVNTISGVGGVQEFLMHQTVTPEPATLILLGTGLALTLGIGVMTKRIA